MHQCNIASCLHPCNNSFMWRPNDGQCKTRVHISGSTLCMAVGLSKPLLPVASHSHMPWSPLGVVFGTHIRISNYMCVFDIHMYMYTYMYIKSTYYSERGDHRHPRPRAPCICLIIIYHHWWSYVIIYDHIWSYLIIHRHLWWNIIIYIIICDHIWSFVVIYDHI